VVIIIFWKVAGELHKPKGILQYAYVPQFVVKVVFDQSSTAIEI
jgi:hypothetical protein